MKNLNLQYDSNTRIINNNGAYVAKVFVMDAEEQEMYGNLLSASYKLLDIVKRLTADNVDDRAISDAQAIIAKAEGR